jgi:hypothetical protein
VTEDICQCVKCGRMHRRLGKPPWRNRSREILLKIQQKALMLDDAKLILDIGELAKILDERIAD